MTETKRPTIFFQDACYRHKYIRSRDLSAIVERPERLRAVTIGLSAALARLESISPHAVPKSEPVDPDDLAGALGRLNITPTSETFQHAPVSIVRSTTSIDLLNHAAVKFIHGDIDGDVYLEKLKRWARDSREKISNGVSEIPEGLPQGDLYLCPESVDAIQGAVATVCEAVDNVITSKTDNRAFVVIRPPGHHCGEDTPSGFCFVNNVAIGAAHAHLKHGVNRVVILDIDLHHGNGTQSIIWQINEETYRLKLEAEAGAPPASKPGLQVYYGSTHDILSYPCEDGKLELVQAASVCLHNAHGQYIENVHLQTYFTKQQFWDVLYKEQYSKILRKAEDFLDVTGGPGDDVMVFISCGMDACEHEYESMSRHNRKVPTSFYHRFARDARVLSDKYARGRLISVLEGGYSDRALMSGAMAHISGLVDETQLQGKIDEEWWNVENLIKLEKATKKRRSGRPSLTPAANDPWLERAVEIFQSLDTSAKTLIPAASSRLLAPSTMTLRDRKSGSSTPSVSPQPSADRKPGSVLSSSGTESSDSSSSSEGEISAPKKLPRVILRLGPDPSLSSPS
ncbi:hypothetical protein H2248_007071 [Termitomyces sp. 'cryptogamus']|nr:hypothetical protein H2248_007071 [Termitomyces sp. 'cryptogamus']